MYCIKYFSHSFVTSQNYKNVCVGQIQSLESVIIRRLACWSCKPSTAADKQRDTENQVNRQTSTTNSYVVYRREDGLISLNIKQTRHDPDDEVTHFHLTDRSLDLAAAAHLARSQTYKTDKSESIVWHISWLISITHNIILIIIWIDAWTHHILGDLVELKYFAF